MDFLFINHKTHGAEVSSTRMAEAMSIFSERGQRQTTRIENDHFRLILFESQSAQYDYKEFSNGDFIVTLGTLFYKDMYGDQCLDPLFNDFCRSDSLSSNDLMGNYCVMIFHDGELFVFNDYLGLYRIYHTEDYSVVTSSFLAIAKILERLTPSPQEIYEYLLRGAMYGGNTLFKEVDTAAWFKSGLYFRKAKRKRTYIQL